MVNLMSNFIVYVKKHLDNLTLTFGGEHIKTVEIRKLSNNLYRELDDKSKANVFKICEELLEEYNWAMGVIAYDFAYRVRKQYDDNTFSIFESWLIKYVRGWGDCDDFCTHAFGELLIQKPECFHKIISWTNREEFWMRRAAAVILIPSINQNKYSKLEPFLISDKLIKDDNVLVCKGYGWMLKVLSIKELELVYNYLVNNRKIMPRVSFRYAIEKMDKHMKEQLMRL